MRIGLTSSNKIDLDYLVWYMNEVANMGEIDILIYKALVLILKYVNLDSY
jgi:hypothetical protein